jgi:transposase-like protein
LWQKGSNEIMAARKRHSPEQIVRKLMAADRMLAEGKDTASVCREIGVSEATYHRWRNQFGGLKAKDANPQATTGRCRVGESCAQGDRAGNF